jgi:hypothetical protein
LGDGGIIRRLSASFGLFSIAIDIVVYRAIEAEGAELHRGTINLVAISWHAHRLLLIEEFARVARHARRATLGSGFAGRRRETTRRTAASLVLLLRC